MPLKTLPKFTGNILITGPLAVGKTFLAHTILHGLTHQGVRAIIVDCGYSQMVTPAGLKKFDVCIFTAESRAQFESEAWVKRGITIARTISLTKH